MIQIVLSNQIKFYESKIIFNTFIGVLAKITWGEKGTSEYLYPEGVWYDTATKVIVEN